MRELGLTQATAHAILKTLCDRGWASRDPVTKTFTLGPALAVVAARTDTARPLAHAARAAALRLSREVGYAGSVVERFGDSLVVTAFEGDAATQPSGIPGDRIPYAPPFGVAFAAWDTDEEQRAWIRRGAGDNADRTRRLERVLEHTRERGFDVDWTTPALAQAVQVVGTLDSNDMPTPVRQIMDQLLVEFTTIGFLSDDNPGRRKAARGDHRRTGFRPTPARRPDDGRASAVPAQRTTDPGHRQPPRRRDGGDQRSRDSVILDAGCRCVGGSSGAGG